MMTPQEVANCTFAKSAIGGYNMASVDDFLDKLTEDYSSLYKENAALKAKLKVMVDKMAEYREMEDAMRSTLLTAQKMASSMVAEAEAKRDAIVRQASSVAEARREAALQEAAAQEKRLADVRNRVDQELEAERLRLATGQEKLRAFIKEVTSVCNEQLALLELLPDLPIEQQAAAVPVMQPAQGAQPAQPEVEEEPASEKEPEHAEAAFAPLPPEEPEEQAVFDVDPFAEDDDEDAPQDSHKEDEDLQETRVLNLEDLQFGRNYLRD